jgi:hypothetical protein
MKVKKKKKKKKKRWKVFDLFKTEGLGMPDHIMFEQDWDWEEYRDG